MPTTPLPFLTGAAPSIRVVEAHVNSATVSLELPVHGALLSGEVLHIEAWRYHHAMTEEIWTLADAFVADGMGPDLAERVATRILHLQAGIPVQIEDSEHRAMLHRSALVAAAKRRLQQELAEQQVRKATAAIRYRVAGQAVWDDDATLAHIPQPLIVALANFLDEEQAGDAPQLSTDEVVETMLETLGKFAPSASTDDQPPTPSTGTTSTGELEPSAPTTPPSPASGSRSRPGRTSSKRSSAAKTTT